MRDRDRSHSKKREAKRMHRGHHRKELAMRATKRETRAMTQKRRWCSLSTGTMEQPCRRTERNERPRNRKGEDSYVIERCAWLQRRHVKIHAIEKQRRRHALQSIVQLVYTGMDKRYMLPRRRLHRLLHGEGWQSSMPSVEVNHTKVRNEPQLEQHSNLDASFTRKGHRHRTPKSPNFAFGSRSNAGPKFALDPFLLDKWSGRLHLLPIRTMLCFGGIAGSSVHSNKLHIDLVRVQGKINQYSHGGNGVELVHVVDHLIPVVTLLDRIVKSPLLFCF